MLSLGLTALPLPPGQSGPTPGLTPSGRLPNCRAQVITQAPKARPLPHREHELPAPCPPPEPAPALNPLLGPGPCPSASTGFWPWAARSRPPPAEGVREDSGRTGRMYTGLLPSQSPPPSPTSQPPASPPLSVNMDLCPRTGGGRLGLISAADCLPGPESWGASKGSPLIPLPRPALPAPLPPARL